MPVEQFNAIYYAAMAAYKPLLLSNPIPYVALLIISRTASRKA